MKQLTLDLFESMCDVVENDEEMDSVRARIQKAVDESPNSVLFEDAKKQSMFEFNESDDIENKSFCFKCGNENYFLVEETEIYQQYKGKLIKISTPVTICDDCKNYFLVEGQTDELIKRTKIKYEKTH